MNTSRALAVMIVCGGIGAAVAGWLVSRAAPAGAVVFSEDAHENAALNDEFQRRLEGLNAEERTSIDAWTDASIKLSLARMYAWFDATTYEPDEMRPFLLELESFPLSRAELRRGQDMSKALFAADVALQSATIAAARFDIPASDRRRMGACAVRAARTAEDDVIRMRAAMLLKTLRDGRPGGALSSEESRTFAALMANDWIRFMVERDWRLVEEITAGAASTN